MSFEVLWEREIREVKEILDDHYSSLGDKTKDVSIQIVKKLFGKGDRCVGT